MLKRLHAGFLSTRVARRTLVHFLSAALLPVLVSSLLGVWFVRHTLITEAAERVERTADASALMLLRQLTSITLNPPNDTSSAFEPFPTAVLTARDSAHLRQGKVVLQLSSGNAATAAVDTGGAVRLIQQAPDGRIMARVASADEIWSALDDLIDGNRTELCVFSVATLRRLYCDPSVTEERAAELRTIAGDSTAVHRASADVVARDAKFNKTPGTDGLLASSRDVYLRYEFSSSEWRVIAAEQRDDALAPASSAVNSLYLLIGLATVTAFTFAHAQIRRSTQPLEALQHATQRVASGDLETPVAIISRDEYGELGTAFNGMTSTLSRQLTLLRVMDEVDRVTLQESDLHSIAMIALKGLRDVRGAEAVTLGLLHDASRTNLSCWSAAGTDAPVQLTDALLSASEYTWMSSHPRQYFASDIDHAHAAAHNDGPGWNQQQGNHGAIVVFPMLHDDTLLGAIAATFTALPAAHPEALADIRRIADRVALGVSNVRMVDQLNALSSGTLLAFARAIDANSPWTAGHSERVTQLSIALGRQLGLSSNELGTLYRGGLMHDIGKIGIPASVLDKPGRLNDAERAVIEKHPEIGERILRPIAGFADALGIVRSHHERFNGTGYPDRLAGEQIPWLARIVAVADVFDALASDRPYRAGLTHRAAITLIEGDSGTHFDPRVVDALRELEHNNSPALSHQASLRELPLRDGSFRDTPHTAHVAVA